jgi:bifunctional N-acetylglucosamine-1-phosphate-uridyltransferase/glucosamine-1-phosphate-acetyltransferase GlmU-like protein
MHSDLPKVLHPLAGKALLAHVIDTARQLGAARICVVYGHGGEQVREALDAPDLSWARQEPATRHRPCRAAGAAASRRLASADSWCFMATCR